MRPILLQVCAGIAALTFTAMLVTTAMHRTEHRRGGAARAALAECVWATIPWIIVVAAALPAARLVMSAR